MNKSFDPTNGTLKIRFESPEAARHFKLWLCESGEQAYWDWMDCREEEQAGNITATEFAYHGDDPNVIETECGRVTT